MCGSLHQIRLHHFLRRSRRLRQITFLRFPRCLRLYQIRLHRRKSLTGQFAEVLHPVFLAANYSSLVLAFLSARLFRFRRRYSSLRDCLYLQN